MERNDKLTPNGSANAIVAGVWLSPYLLCQDALALEHARAEVQRSEALRGELKSEMQSALRSEVQPTAASAPPKGGSCSSKVLHAIELTRQGDIASAASTLTAHCAISYFRCRAHCGASCRATRCARRGWAPHASQGRWRVPPRDAQTTKLVAPIRCAT
jgi:hypothetical protein